MAAFRRSSGLFARWSRSAFEESLIDRDQACPNRGEDEAAHAQSKREFVILDVTRIRQQAMHGGNRDPHLDGEQEGRNASEKTQNQHCAAKNLEDRCDVSEISGKAHMVEVLDPLLRVRQLG